MMVPALPPIAASLTGLGRLLPYAGSETNLSFDEPDFALIDTLFSLAEAHLFMQLVEIKDGELAELPPGKSYADLYRWVSEVNWTRASV